MLNLLRKDAAVPEYVIRPADRVEWPAIPAAEVERVLTPAGYGTQRVPGDGDLRLLLGPCEMVFAGEEVGWPVWFEGDVTGHDTDALISLISDQVAAFKGEPMQWIRYD